MNRKLAIYRDWSKQFVHKRVEEAKSKFEENPLAESKDIIEALIKDRINSEEQYTEDEIVKEFSNFFMAGTDTTSNYVQGMIYLIAQHPEVERKVRKEISDFMENEDYSFENLKNFHYIDWVQKETTRFFGPANFLFTREVKRDHFIKGIRIPKGIFVDITTSNHYNPKYFKDPLTFRPERWEK